MNEEIEAQMKKVMENLGTLTEEAKAELLKEQKPFKIPVPEPRLHIDGYFTYDEVSAIIEALRYCQSRPISVHSDRSVKE